MSVKIPSVVPATPSVQQEVEAELQSQQPVTREAAAPLPMRVDSEAVQPFTGFTWDGAIDDPNALPHPYLVAPGLVREPPFGLPGLKSSEAATQRQAQQLDRLTRLRKLWSDAAHQSQTNPPSVELAGTSMRAVPGPELRRATGRLPAQKAFEKQAQEAGKSTLWVQVDGRLEGLESPGKQRNDVFVGWAKGRPVSYTMQAPYLYNAQLAPREEAASELVKKLQTPPLSREALMALPEGSVIELRGSGFVGTESRHYDGGKPEEPEHDFVIRVYRLDGNKVRIVTEWERTRWKWYRLDKDRIAKEALSKVPVGFTAGVEIKAELHVGQTHTEAYAIDLSDPTSAQAQEALMTLDVDAIRDIASKQADVSRDGTIANRDVDYSVNAALPGDLLAGNSGVFGWGAGLQVWNNELSPKDPRIINDSLRYAETQRAAEAGQKLRWMENGGLVEPRLSLIAGAAEGLPANVQAGLQLGSVLRYNIVSAYDGGRFNTAKDGLVRMARAAMADPTHIADDDVPPGTEIALQRLVTIRELARYGVGYDREFGYGFEIAATAGVEASNENSYDKVVVLKKLDDGRVLVTVRASSQDTQRGLGTDGSIPGSIRAVVGFDVNVADAAREYDDSDSAMAKFFEGRLGGQLGDLIDRPINRILAMRFEAGGVKTDRRSHSQQFVFDLKKDDDKKLLRSLTAIYARKNAKQREALAQALEDHRRVAYDERTKSTNYNLQYDALARTLVRHGSGDTERDGTLRTADGQFYFQQEDAHRNHKFMRTLNAQWEAYRVETDLPGEKNAFRFHCNIVNDDPLTSTAEVEEFLKLVQVAEAKLISQDPNYPKVEPGNWAQRMFWFSKHGQTTQKVDLTIERDGIGRIAKTDAPSAERAFVSVASVFDPDAGNPPWLEPMTFIPAGNGATRIWTAEERVKSIAIINEYIKAERAAMPGDRDDEDKLDGIKSDYYRLTKRRLTDDVANYVHAKRFSGAIGKLREALAKPNGQEEALKVITALGEGAWNDDTPGDRDTFFWRYLGSLLVLARAENVVLTELSMVGKHVDARAQSEGRVEHPTQVVPRYFDDNVAPDDDATPGGVRMAPPWPITSSELVSLPMDWNASSEWAAAVEEVSAFAKKQGFGPVLMGDGPKIGKDGPDGSSVLATGYVNAAYYQDVMMVGKDGVAMPIGRIALVDDPSARPPRLKSKARLVRELSYLFNVYRSAR